MKGMSLSEVLISLFLTSVMMMTLIQLYLGSKRQYIEAEQIMETHFDLQWVNDLLSNSIRRAGFTPCLGIDQLQIVDRRNNPKTIRSLRVENHPNPFIQVDRMNEYFTKVIKITNSMSIEVQDSLELHANLPLIIADCVHAEIHELDRIEQQGKHSLLVLTKPLVFSYPKSAYVGEFMEERWFIKPNKKGKSTLYYQAAQAEELTSLIHSLSVTTQQVNGRQFLELVLGLDEEKKHIIKVAVRGT